MKITEVTIYGVKESPMTGEDFVDIYWENDEGEFGHIDLHSSDGDLEIDSEHMGREFVKQVFNKLIDSATLKE